MKTGGSVDLRDAVETHRASQREEVRREESAAGRRLTAAELAELRAQVRSQWAGRADTVQSTDSRPAGTVVLGGMPHSAQPVPSTLPLRR